MEKSEILRHVDHTLLSQSATWEDIKKICDDGIRYACASVCIPPCFVRPAAEYAAGRIAVCTVIGFPNGYSKTEIKCAETEAAVADGAAEIDMVINVGLLRAGKDEAVAEEIRAVKKACGGRLLKVIIETCLLTEDEKRRMCRIVSDSGAEYIKTSTGFAGGGATFDDIRLFRACVDPHVRIKAAGGISSFEDAETFLSLGADRLGTSRLVKLIKAEENE